MVDSGLVVVLIRVMMVIVMQVIVIVEVVGLLFVADRVIKSMSISVWVIFIVFFIVEVVGFMMVVMVGIHKWVVRVLQVMMAMM